MIVFGALLAIGGILFPINKRKSKAYFRTFVRHFGKFALASFAIAIIIAMIGFEDSFLYEQFLMCDVIMFFVYPVILWIRRKMLEKEEEEFRKNPYKKTAFKADEKERRKIIEDFNEKYELNLSEKHIDNMIAGSFVNTDWENEIAAMENKYSSINEWLNGSTGWFRVYLKVFNTESITSDFGYQKEICLSQFAEMFDSVKMEKFSSVEEVIKAINNSYYTLFDETSFMIVYRFLQDNGKRYCLPKAGVIKHYSELEELAKKYDEGNAETIIDNIIETKTEENKQMMR